MAEWFLKVNEEKVGPVTTEALKRLVAEGQLRPSDAIWREGLASWVRASNVKGLFPEAAPSPALNDNVVPDMKKPVGEETSRAVTASANIPTSGQQAAVPDLNSSLPLTTPPSIPVWHYSVEGSQAGPVSDDELKALAKNGQLRRSDKVWKDGMAAWTAAGGIPGLFPSTPQSLRSGPPPLQQIPSPPSSPVLQRVRAAAETARTSPDQLRSTLWTLLVLRYVLIGLSVLIFIVEEANGSSVATTTLWVILFLGGLGCGFYRRYLIKRHNDLARARNDAMV